MAGGVAAEFEPIYVSMGSLGWSPPSVDLMMPWTVARFLGDEEAGFEYVVRGVRDGLRLPSDAKDDGGGGFRDRSLRARLRHPGRELGRLLTGDDARG